MDCPTKVVDAVAFAEQYAGVNPWVRQCVRQLDFSFILTNGGLVGAGGTPGECLNQSTWGVTRAICDKYCSYSQMPPGSRFVLLSFLQGFSSLVLPWVALTAQLPYEAGGIRHDLMSGNLAVGSPTLITFSLATTISNRRWAMKAFHRVIQKARTLPEGSWERDAWLEIAENMGIFVAEAQQEPLRVELLEFVKLGTLKEQRAAWKLLRERMRVTQRQWTASLVAQLAVAGISWVLTIVLSFMTEFGNIDAALPVAAGILWMWMIPVVLGWVVVGTQSKDFAADDAFREAFGLGWDDAAGYSGHRARVGTLVSEKILPEEEVERQEQVIEDEEREALPPETRWWGQGPDAHGDITHRGPLYNYARAATWWQFARELERYAHMEIDSLIAAKSPGPLTLSFREAQGRIDFAPVIYQPKQDTLRDHYHDPEHQGAQNSPNAGVDSIRALEVASKDTSPAQITKDSEEASPTKVSFAYPVKEATTITTKLEAVHTPPRQPYPSLEAFWHEGGKLRLVYPHLMAWFMQFGTAMPAFLIAYETIPVGLGCSSGSYLLYMVASVLVYLFLFVSASISHQILHDEHQRRASGKSGTNLRTFKMVIRSHIARILLWIGKGLAICNGWWLVLSTFFELTGVYNTCTCNSSFFGLGSSAWIVLFKSEDEVKDQGRAYWTAGLCMAVAVMVTSIVLLVGSARFKRR